MNWFLLFTILSGMSINAEYAITRPASNALFLTFFSAKAYPFVWLATVPLNLFVIFLYNRFLPKIGPLKMLLTLCFIAMGINSLCGLFVSSAPWIIFFQYAWKDIYILLMFKQLWSMIHTTIHSKKAKYIYGIIYGMGTIGAIIGSLIPGFFALKMGTEQLFFFTAPLYTCLIFFYWLAYRSSELQKTPTQLETPLEGGFSMIRNSRYLGGILLLVVLMQFSVGLMEYQFNTKLETDILNKDLRTEYCGRVIGSINAMSLIFQFLGGFLMVHLLGLKRSHFLIPVLLGASAVFSWAVPSFALLSFSYAFLKSVDFSLFGVIREMLYIPLKVEEKFRAKAIIDVFAYRSSKALVSLSIILLQTLAGTYLLRCVSALSIAIFMVWIGVVALLFRKNQPPVLSQL